MFDDDDDTGIVYRDMVTLLLCGFVTVSVLLMSFINPSARQDDTNGAPNPGGVLIEVEWPSDINADVDLWVQAPGDVPVGYSNKGGRIFNLLRDDLGNYGDISNINYENALSRGIPAGEYTVNLHLYRNRSGRDVVPCRVIVSRKADAAARSERLLTASVELTAEGQELTVFNFSLDENGMLLPKSINSIPHPLRSKT